MLAVAAQKFVQSNLIVKHLSGVMVINFAGMTGAKHVRNNRRTKAIMPPQSPTHGRVGDDESIRFVFSARCYP